MDNKDLEQVMNFLVTSYSTCFPDMPSISISIICSECMSKTYMELRPDLSINSNLSSVDQFNGLMIVPKKRESPFSIVLNKKAILDSTNDRSMTWLGTFAHEVTHAIDYYQMALLEELSNYDALLKKEDYLMFQLWSEFHARKKGYTFLRKQLDVDNVYEEDDNIQYILQTEWPTHKERHFKDYHETSNGEEQMNATMQLIGRYSVWCELFPSHFNSEVFKSDFAYTSWICDLFDFLVEHNSLDKVYNNFEEMRAIMRDNWDWL